MEEINEHLMRFLDADDYEDKLRILEEVKDKVDDRVIGMMASALSISTGGAEGEELLDHIRDYLTLQNQYDGKRFR